MNINCFNAAGDWYIALENDQGTKGITMKWLPWLTIAELESKLNLAKMELV